MTCQNAVAVGGYARDPGGRLHDFANNSRCFAAALPKVDLQGAQRK